MLRFNKYSIPVVCIGLIPLWWLLGFGLFIFHASSLYIAILLGRRILPRDSFQLALLGLMGVLSFSLAFNSFVYDVEFARIFAALNNLSVIIVGYCHYTFFRVLYQRDEDWARRVSKMLFSLCVVSILLAIPLSYAVFSGRMQILEVPTFFGLLLPPMDNLLGMYQRAQFVARNWFDGGDMPRLMILSTNATASAGLIAISSFVAVGWVIFRGYRRAWIFLGLVLFTLAVTLTRAAILGAVLGSMVIMLAVFKKKYYLLLIAAAPLVIAAALSFLPDMLSRVNSMREGSSDARFLAYEASFNEAMRVNPVIGLGIKPRVDDLAIPIGSHSTLFSTLVRGGGLGFLCALTAFFIIPAAKGAKLGLKLIRKPTAFGRRRPYAIAALGGLPSLLVFCAFQDIDVYAPITAVFFTYIAGLMYWSEAPVTRGANE